MITSVKTHYISQTEKLKRKIKQCVFDAIEIRKVEQKTTTKDKIYYNNE